MLIKYRAFKYELCKNNNYQYRKYEIAIVGEEYHKTIPLFKEDIVNVYKLWNILKDKTIAALKSSMPRKSKYDWFE